MFKTTTQYRGLTIITELDSKFKYHSKIYEGGRCWCIHSQTTITTRHRQIFQCKQIIDRFRAFQELHG